MRKIKGGSWRNPRSKPHPQLRKYTGYAQLYVHPRPSTEAAQIPQDFYLELWKQSQWLNGPPVTTRQLGSLICLTEAQARSEGREEATKKDAEDFNFISFHRLPKSNKHFRMLILKIFLDH